MKIRSVQGLAGGSGVTFLAGQLALAEQRLGRNVVVLDLNPDRCLHSQLTDDSFHYLGDVRELFSDRARLDLTTRKLPINGIFSYAFDGHAYLTRNAKGELEMAFEKPIRTDDDAQVQIAAACHELAAFYDVMILDVPVTDAGLMRVIAGISDEVHLILPDMPIGMRSEEDWRYKIGLCESEKTSPKVVTYAERSRAFAA